ncbi:MAG: hypothetical protein ACT4QE_00425, partial [Anaerolineales bacterium]
MSRKFWLRLLEILVLIWPALGWVSIQGFGMAYGELIAPNLLSVSQQFPPPAEATLKSQQAGMFNRGLTLGYVTNELTFEQIHQHYAWLYSQDGWHEYNWHDTSINYCKGDILVTLYYNGLDIYETEYDLVYAIGKGRMLGATYCERLGGLGVPSLFSLAVTWVFFVLSVGYGTVMIWLSRQSPSQFIGIRRDLLFPPKSPFQASL